MIKKLVKYAKMAIAMALIVSLALPSYATVGASDGSAFVTKAEFDAALSDFNARLTTFEAGINSKIDSQVSSYLDRNGIWNGSEQTLTDQARAGFILSYASTQTTESIEAYNYDGSRATGNPNSYPMTSTIANLFEDADAKECTGTPNVISTITKSGMIALDTEYRNFAAMDLSSGWSYNYLTSAWNNTRFNKELESYTGASNSYWRGYMKYEGGSSGRLCPLFQTKFEFQVNSKTLYAITTCDYSGTPANLYKGITDTGAVQWYVQVPNDAHSSRNIVYFFVQKGDVLKIKSTKNFSGSWTAVSMYSFNQRSFIGTVLKCHSASIY